MSKIPLPPRKKLEGSFFKRNWWIFIVIIAISGVSVGIWFLYSRVRDLKRVYMQRPIVYKDSAETAVSADRLAETPYDPSIKLGILELKTDAAILNLKDTTDRLFVASSDSSNANFHFDTKQQYQNCIINFYRRRQENQEDANELEESSMALNVNPVWSIDVTGTSAQLDFDLSKFKVQRIFINVGAGKIHAKLGAKLVFSRVNISAGRSNTTIDVPSAAGVRITFRSRPSTDIFEGFQRKSTNRYETVGFENAKNKIYIEMNGGISDFKVHKY